MTTTDPQIYLVADNCFAIKRWVEPHEWLAVARDLGLSYVQASTDNEFDALYSDPAYMRGWVAEVFRASQETGVHVRSVYTGYQTYRTCGLGHPDARVRDRIIDGWVKPTIDWCAELGAELGFHLFAYPDSVLQDRASYLAVTDRIIDDLAGLADYAQQQGVRISVEQMYSPHQPPWTIEQSRYFLAEVYRRAGAACYVTVDTGHQVGQAKFRRPSAESIASVVAAGAGGQKVQSVWLGPESAFRLAERASIESRDDLAMRVAAELDANPQFFSQVQDSDLYEWVRHVGRHSPLMHLQQTDGTGSHHAPFTRATNERGVVHPLPLLQALRDSYQQTPMSDMPPPVDSVSLSFEIFSGTAETPREVLAKMRESIQYWRQAIPTDGLRLSELLRD
jgi:sugar phosphate isomerase/epimerase